jgi:hypothetical protein
VLALVDDDVLNPVGSTHSLEFSAKTIPVLQWGQGGPPSLPRTAPD